MNPIMNSLKEIPLTEWSCLVDDDYKKYFANLEEHGYIIDDNIKLKLLSETEVKELVDINIPLAACKEFLKKTKEYIDNYNFDDPYINLDEPVLYLNTLPPQHVCSKTQTYIDFIKYAQKLLNLKTKEEETSKFHHITFIFANNSLLETKQWNKRVKVSDLNVYILSSKSEINSRDKLETLLRETEKYEDLPDVVVMCGNERRLGDIITLMKYFKNGQTKLNSKTKKEYITISMAFDEADKLTGLIGQFLESDLYKSKSGLIDCTFITATPEKEFWKFLKKYGITNLVNIRTTKEDIETIDDREEINRRYVNFTSHKKIIENNKTNKPIEYIKKNYHHVVEFQKKEKTPTITFAPAACRKTSHDELAKYILETYENTCVIILNGKDKVFKFRDKPDISLDKLEEEYKERKKKEPELKDLLVFFRTKFPKINILITGHNVIERGLTFNTVGFQFTHMILSNYHAKHISFLIQIIGRGCGNKDYVSPMIIICTKKIMDEASARVKRSMEIFEINPDEFKQEIFENMKDKFYKAKHIPIIINIDQNILEETFTPRYNKNAIKDFLINHESTRSSIIKDIDIEYFYITTPGKETDSKISSYDRKIIHFVDAANEKKQKAPVDNKFPENENCCFVYIDKYHPRIVVVIWEGKAINY